MGESAKDKAKAREESKEATREAPGFVPAIILRNKGVPVTIFRLEKGALPEVEDDEELPTRTVHLRFDANAMADLEDAFDGLVASVPIIERKVTLGSDGTALVGPQGPIYDEKVLGYEDRRFYGLEAFQKAMEVKMTTTVRRAMAVALGMEPHEMGLAMDPAQSADYQVAVGVAWSMAQGVDPTSAARTLHEGRAAVAKKLDSLASELTKTMEGASDETTDSPGLTG